MMGLLLLTGCEESNNNEVQERKNILDDGVTITYTYTDMLGEEIVDELLSNIRMPIGSKDEALFYKKDLTYKDIPNKDRLLLGAKNYKDENPDATTMTSKEMKKEVQKIFTDEVEIKNKSVTDNDCEGANLIWKDDKYELPNGCEEPSGQYMRLTITADDVNKKAIEIAEKVAYVEIDGNEKVIYKYKGGKEIKRVDIDQEIDLSQISGLVIVKYTFIKYKDQYYFYSSELIGK